MAWQKGLCLISSQAGFNNPIRDEKKSYVATRSTPAHPLGAYKYVCEGMRWEAYQRRKKNFIF